MIYKGQKHSINSLPALSLKFLILYCILTLGHTSTTEEPSPPKCLQPNNSYLCNWECNCDYPPDYRSLALNFELCFAILGLFTTLINVIGSLTVKELREPPGDIFLGLSLATTVLCITWITEIIALFNLTHHEMGDSEFCLGAAYVDVFFSSVVYAYSLSFFIFFYVLTRTSLKITKIPQLVYHALALGGSCVFFIVIHMKPSVVFKVDNPSDLFGMSVYGQCTFKTTSSIRAPMVAMALSLIIPVIMYYTTAKSLPKCKAISKARYHFLKEYLKLVFGFCVVSFLIDIVAIYVGATLGDLQNNIKEGSFLPFIMRLLNTILRIIRPGVLTVIRLMDPNLSQYWQRTFFWSLLNCCCCKRRKNKNDIEVSLNGEIQKEDLDGKKKMMSMTVRAVHKQLKNSPYLYQIQHAVRVQVLYTLLCSIHCFWGISKKSAPDSRIVKTKENKIDYQATAKLNEKIEMNGDILKKELPQMIREIQQRNYKLIDGRLTAHAPALFEQLLKMDKNPDSVSISLDLSANYNRILNAGHSKGGKSGEFFFFSYDENLVIKTISDKELKTLLEIMPSYVQHFKNNPHSLIAKIYGVFTFERVDPYEKYNLILMKNVCGFPNKCVERKYDLKGSTYTRATVKNGNPQLHELKFFDQILKDLDFNQFEKKIHISNPLKYQLIEALEKDTAFLREHELIDYSLVLYIIDKTTLEQKNLSNESFKVSLATFGTSPQMSNLTPGHFGAINRTAEPESYVPSPMLRFEIASRDSLTMDKKGGDRVDRARTFQGESFGHLGSLKDKKAAVKEETSLNSIRCINDPEETIYYHLGIIDYLIKYTWKKRVEKFWKKLIMCNPKLDISVQNPDYYAERFMNYMKKIVDE